MNIQFFKGINKMRLFNTLFLSVILVTATFADMDLDSVLHALAGPDYEARQEARVELYALAAQVTEDQDSAAMRAQFCSAIATALSMEDMDVQGKVFLTRILTRAGSADSVPALLAVGQDPGQDAVVREHAIMAISAIPGEAVSQQLLQGLKAAAAGDRNYWMQAIQHQADPSIAKALANVIGKEKLASDPSAWTALGRIGGPEAASLLMDALKKAGAADKPALQRAILESRGCDARQLRQLLGESADASVTAGAFNQLCGMDQNEAVRVLEEMFVGTPLANRQLLIRTALDSGGQGAWDSVLAHLGQLTSNELGTLLAAIGEQNRKSYEPVVLDYLQSDDHATRVAALGALAAIGSGKSTASLIGMLDAEDEEILDLVIYALAQVDDPQLDEQIVSAVSDSNNPNRKEMIKLIAIRNSDGAIGVINGILEAGVADPAMDELLSAVEAIGDVNSCRILLRRLLDSPDKSDSRKIQLSIKRLTIQLALVNYLWEHAFLPAIELASQPETKGSVLEILDCLSSEKALEYCADCVQDDQPKVIETAALAAMRRWTSMNIKQYWIDRANDKTSSNQEVREARSALVRLIRSNTVVGEDWEKAQMGFDMLTQVQNNDFQKEVLDAINSNKKIAREFERLLEPYDSILSNWKDLTESSE